MLPENATKTWLVVLGIVVLAVIGSSYFFSKQNISSKKPTNESTEKRAFPSKAIAKLVFADFRIVYQKAGDTEGRTMIYKGAEDKTPYSGIWIVERDHLNGKYRYVVGVLEDIKTIDGSQDKLITLYNPVTKADVITARIVYQKDNFQTKLTLEDMSKVSSGDSDETLVEHRETIDKINPEKLKAFMQTGDAVVLVLTYPIDGKLTKQFDQNGNPMVRRMVLRRNDTKEFLSL